MRIIRAEHLGICFGMRDAVALALQQAECEPLTILGELVNNETVLAALRAKGIHLEPRVQDVGTRTVMVTAQNTQPIERVRHLVQPSGIRGGGVRRHSRPDDGPILDLLSPTRPGSAWIYRLARLRRPTSRPTGSTHDSFLHKAAHED